MKRKCLAIGIILLFIGTCIIPAIAQDTEKPSNDFVLSQNMEYKKPQKIVGNAPEYNPGDLDTPLFNFTELMNDSGQTAYGVSSADFNNDGKIDFAVTYADAPILFSHLTIFYNSGNGSYTQENVYNFFDLYIQSIATGDFDNDGDVDIIYSYNEVNGQSVYIYGLLRILYNDGTNHFTYSKLIAKRGTGIPFDPEGRINMHITSADYDGDEDIDLLVGDNSGNVEFYLNNGTGNFTSAGIIYDYGLQGLTWGLTSADYDGDGDIDFLVTARVQDYYGHIWFKQNMMVESNQSIVFEQTPGIIIADIKPEYGCIQGTSSLTSIDYNNDGNMDFIAGIGNYAYLFMNKEGVYEPFYICALPDGTEGYADSLTAGGTTSDDYDNDGYMDVVMGGVQGYIRLLINNHVLAVITRPKDAYWYKFNVEQYQIFQYKKGVGLCIGKITINVTELENIEKVEYYINGILRSSDTSPPYNFTWRIGNPLKHRHTIKIMAYSANGKISEDEIRMWRFL